MDLGLIVVSFKAKLEELRKFLPIIYESRLSANKIVGKKFVSDLGIRVPKDLITGSYVVKPHNNSMGNGVIVVHDNVALSQLVGSQVIVEELIVDENGSIPPRDFKLYCFGGEAKMVQVIDERPDYSIGYYEPQEWVPLKGLSTKSWKDHEPPSCIKEMLAISARLSKIFFYPVRVDLYASSEGVVFGEFCLIAGVRHHITELGTLYLDHGGNNILI